MKNLAAEEPIALEYWLSHCQGFRVDSPDGRVGFVEDVCYGVDPDRPEALAVRVGILGRKVVLVAVDEVVEIIPRKERIILRAMPPLAQDEAEAV